ncbi:MAG: T9SS type A sorting domain-containing protein [Paludibacteraceae bacterium]|nr:T9SS type A sorting domain-containing protein [Paludibacteraceae bacterium]
MRKRLLIVFVVLLLPLWLVAAVTIHISDPKRWGNSALESYVGQEVVFDVPMYIVNNNRYQVAPCRIFSNSIRGGVTEINGISGYHRMGEMIRGLKAYVGKSGNGCYLSYKGGTFFGNTRDDILKGPDMRQIDANGQHTLLVCAANLEYYLVETFGTGYGPDNAEEHEKQRTKTIPALSLINADIYGFCEVERGTGALGEICRELNKLHPERQYDMVYNGVTLSGSYTMSCYVYDKKKVMAVGPCWDSQTGVKCRKFMQLFIEKETGEGFIFSINHFQSKVSADDEVRTREAYAVNSLYETYSLHCYENDVLIMGDLNAYPDEDPIQVLLQNGKRTDLHTYFHADTSYSYTYSYDNFAANYLDHAICNASMLPQVTGMQAYHINSDERDCYTYDGGCYDGSMFRYSDHDPILVGLRLSGEVVTGLMVNNFGMGVRIRNGEGGYVRIYDINGNLITQSVVDNSDMVLNPVMQSGCYIIHVYHDGQTHVTKYIHP